MELLGWLKESPSELGWKDSWTNLGKDSLKRIWEIVEDLDLRKDILRLGACNKHLNVCKHGSSSRYFFVGKSTRVELAEFWVQIVEELKIGPDDLSELSALVTIVERHEQGYPSL